MSELSRRVCCAAQIFGLGLTCYVGGALIPASEYNRAPEDKPRTAHEHIMSEPLAALVETQDHAKTKNT